MTIIFNKGDTIYDILNEKSGIIEYLINDICNRYIYDNNSIHYYYRIIYDDGTFNTNISGEFLIKTEFETINIIHLSKKNNDISFKLGQRIENIWTKKTGTISYFRNNKNKQNLSSLDINHNYYYVDYDDGTFQTLEYSIDLKKI